MRRFNPVVITLKNREDRIKSIKEYYGEIQLYFGASKEDIRENKKKITTTFCNHFCTIPMVGCASSHISVWKNISKKSEGFYMVIEDDTFINLANLDTLFPDIEKKFKQNPNMFLQVVGEGLIHEYTEYYESLVLDKYRFHFFLGCYIITPKVANILYTYFEREKISYHIDLVLNSIEGIDMRILRNKNLGTQDGRTDSNMKKGSNTKIFQSKNNEHLYYALNFPICSVFDFVITFSTIFLLLVFTLACVFKNHILFFFLGIIWFEVIIF